MAGPDGARQGVEGAGDVGVPEHVEAQEGPVDGLAHRQPRGRRVLAALERGDDAARSAVHARAAAEIGQRLGAGGRQRRQQRAVLALDRALQQRLGHGARARAQDPPAAAVVARGRHDARPSGARWPPARRRPARWWSARGSGRAPRRRGPRPSRRRAPTTRACPSRSAAAGCSARRRRCAGRRGRRGRRSTGRRGHAAARRWGVPRRAPSASTVAPAPAHAAARSTRQRPDARHDAGAHAARQRRARAREPRRGAEDERRRRPVRDGAGTTTRSPARPRAGRRAPRPAPSAATG